MGGDDLAELSDAASERSVGATTSLSMPVTSASARAFRAASVVSGAVLDLGSLAQRLAEAHRVID